MIATATSSTARRHPPRDHRSRDNHGGVFNYGDAGFVGSGSGAARTKVVSASS
jgi:hypothetical protein